MNVLCPTCRRHLSFGAAHQCPPAWDWRAYYHESGPDEYWDGPIFAGDPESAAMQAAELYDQDDNTLLRGNSVVIEVRLTGTQDITRWDARAEASVEYYVEGRL